MDFNFAENFCTPPRKKKARYFGHVPSPQITIKKDLQVQREDIARFHLQDLDTADDRLLQLVVRLGYSQVMKVASVLNIIPKNFPNRLKYFVNIVRVIKGLDHLSVSELNQIAVVLDNMNIPRCDIQDVLWEASYVLKIPVVTFLSPITDECIVDGCNGKLYGAEKEVTSFTLFTMDGPVPGLKCVLSCKECGSR